MIEEAGINEVRVLWEAKKPTYRRKYIAAFIALFGSVFGDISAKAEFVKSESILYENWLDLAVNKNPIPPLTEYGAYAIVETGGENLPVTYVIFSSTKGKMAVHGVFRCDKAFSVQKLHTNGLYDIRCVKQDVFGQQTVTSLKFGKSGLYEEHF